MKKFLLMAILFSTLSCSGQDGNLPDKKTMAVIKKAEKVVYHALDPMAEDMSNGEIYGTAKTGYSRELEKSEKENLINLINEKKANYLHPGKGKFCPSAPQDAFIFVKGKDTVQFVVDLNCATYSIIHDTTEYEYDFEKCQEKVSQLIKSMREQNSVASNSIAPLDSAKNILTEKMKRIISESDSVVCYLLDPMDMTSTDTLNGFCILDNAKVESKLVDSLKNILLDKQNFVYSQLLKNCTFLCDMNFRMFAKGEYADVMFAFYCDDCVIVCNDEHIISDSRNMHKEILEIAKCVFPKDRYIRYLLNY